MDKFIDQLEESATVKQLLVVVNKREKRTLVNYIKYYIPFLVCCIALYVAVILLIIFGIGQYIAAFVSTFTFIFILFVWGIFDKYFSLKIFRFIRQKEIEHFSE